MRDLRVKIRVKIIFWETRRDSTKINRWKDSSWRKDACIGEYANTAKLSTKDTSDKNPDSGWGKIHTEPPCRGKLHILGKTPIQQKGESQQKLRWGMSNKDSPEEAKGWGVIGYWVTSSKRHVIWTPVTGWKNNKLRKNEYLRPV